MVFLRILRLTVAVGIVVARCVLLSMCRFALQPEACADDPVVQVCPYRVHSVVSPYAGPIAHSGRGNL